MKYLMILMVLMFIGCTKKVIHGVDGSSCSVKSFTNGAVISCTNGTSSVIYNGVDGTDGVDGISSVIEVIPLCPENGKFTEVILRLNDGRLLAHYSDGNKQFLTIIGNGDYRTTDGYTCNFSVVDGEVVL